MYSCRRITAIAFGIALISIAMLNAEESKDPEYTITANTPSGGVLLGCVEGRILFRSFEPKLRKENVDLPVGRSIRSSITWKLEEAGGGLAFKILEDDRDNHGYLTYDPAHPEKGIYLSETLVAGSIWNIKKEQLRNAVLSVGELHFAMEPQPKTYLISDDASYGIMREYAPTMSREAVKLEILRTSRPIAQPSVVVFRAGGTLFGRADGQVGWIESKMVPDGNLEALPERKAKLSTMWTSQPARGGAYLKSRGQYLSFDPAAPEDGLRMVEKEVDAVVWSGTAAPGRGTRQTRIIAEIKGKKWGIAWSEGIDRFFMPPGSIISVRLPNISDDPKEWTTFESEEGSR